MEIKKVSEKKNQKQSKVKLNKLSSPYKGNNQYENISCQKKIESSISSMTKENRDYFRDALSKYSFDTEVFIPKSISINKNEYKNKNYLLNNLVSFEHKSQERKKLVEPLRKETKRFAKQYKLIKEENEEHQKEYLKTLEDYYNDIGYNANSIEFKKADNIFLPSSVLDHNFGINIQDDAYKFGSIDLKKDYSLDQKLLKKWQKGIQETKENKNRAKRIEEENEIKGINNEEMKEKEKEKEKKNDAFQKEVDKIKNNLMEENRIRNMTKEEYFYYNRKIKNEIKNTKKLIEDFKEENENNNYSYLKKLTINNPKENRISKTYKILHPKSEKNYKEKIVISLDLSDKNREKKIKSQKKFVKNYLTPKFQIREKLKESKPVSITENNIFISSDKIKNKNEKKDLPILPLILNTEQNYSKNEKEKKNEIISEKMLQKMKQENELCKLYNLVYSNKKNILERFPYKSVESYFKKYTNKRIPVLNYKKGSNIHGLIEDLQQIVRKNENYKIAESSNDVKKEFLNKRGLSYNKLIEQKNLDVDKIQEIDDKIPELHYIFAENLLTNKPKKNNNKK